MSEIPNSLRTKDDPKKDFSRADKIAQQMIITSVVLFGLGFIGTANANGSVIGYLMFAFPISLILFFFVAPLTVLIGGNRSSSSVMKSLAGGCLFIGIVLASALGLIIHACDNFH